MDMRIPPLKRKILLESNPMKSRILVRTLAVVPVRVAVPVPAPVPLPVRARRSNDRIVR